MGDQEQAQEAVVNTRHDPVSGLLVVTAVVVVQLLTTTLHSGRLTTLRAFAVAWAAVLFVGIGWLWHRTRI